MSFALPTRRGEPFAELNTTPLIDVLLVLLVMLILALPPATNTLPLPLPSAGPRSTPKLDPVHNVVAVTAVDAILWNGEPVGEGELAALLQAATALNPEPTLELAPDGRASYDKSVRVLRLVKLSGATRIGIVGNERFRGFAR
jgi:biopolymer transport protein ExbD